MKVQITELYQWRIRFRQILPWEQNTPLYLIPVEEIIEIADSEDSARHIVYDIFKGETGYLSFESIERLDRLSND